MPPRFNLSRLRVSGDLLEIGPEHLRFRSWEVERLFRDFHGEPLPPEELARLARRTEGWAAGLQLFHLATRGKLPDERRRVLAALGPSARLVREYLARNVLEQLPAELREFLVATSVLGRLSGSICDAFLGTSGSQALLEDLERRCVFTAALPDGQFRYHEVLRTYLQSVLVEQHGDARARERFSAAAELLASVGAVPEALEAFVRAGDWEGAESLLDRHGESVADRSTTWLDAMPPAILRHDPWLMLAGARRLSAEGRLDEAIEVYAQAERAFGSADAALTARRERQVLATWREPPSAVPSSVAVAAALGWPALLRSAVTREPLAVARAAAALGTPAGRVVAGLATLIAGQIREARRLLLDVAEDPDAEGLPAAVAGLGAGVAALLAGDSHGDVEIMGAVGAAEGLGMDWLARLGLATLALGGRADRIHEAEALAATAAAAGDGWGTAITRLAVAWGRLVGGDAESEVPAIPTVGFRALGASVLEAWSAGLEALAAARAVLPDADEATLAAELAARAAGVPAVGLLTAIARLAGDVADAAEWRGVAEQIEIETGLRPMGRGVDGPGAARPSAASAETDAALDPAVAPAAGAATRVPPARLRLLGGFGLEVGGAPVSVGALRPRVRILLRLLCLHAGTALHRETIQEALWPESDPQTGARNLHVAMAALRRVLEPGAARGSFRLVRREGDGYVLALPPGAEVDLFAFEAAADAAREAIDSGDRGAAERWLRLAVDLYTGDLLPEDGPADWVTERREAVRVRAIDAAQALVELLLVRGDTRGAARICAQGMAIDRYHDPFWRLLIEARVRAGDPGAARQVRQGYHDMLAELGVDPGAVPA